jgi:hypothetical protein
LFSCVPLSVFFLFSFFFPSSSLLASVFLFKTSPSPVFDPFSGFYSQRMHAFSLIIKTLSIVIAEVMVTVGDGRGVRFSLAL